ncbi:homoserine kinase [Fluviispira multicolorata]|uniref:Homoserine kinase n=1 Tax=Fluviispira multicolorata TaxID=2654512 RepID=A0A833JG68_9BACT|nr:homoserine kinase [Fluviispira multicolorata]KAB8033695.1 homoserine kinase [Fluviispira multicolorata]
MLKKDLKSVTAFAPATCANVAVGFDILGFSFDGVGDTVTLKRRLDNKIIIENIDSPEIIPLNPEKNTASVVIKKLCEDLNIQTGFSISIRKGIALGSGMGGSAASAVAALVACNEFLLNPLSLQELSFYALFGEEAACGQKHADNIVPCLFGGMTLIQSSDPIHIVELPVPNLNCILIHPHLKIETKHARGVLKNELPLKDYVKQSANTSSFIAALYQGNYDLLKKSSQDFLIEPQRAHLVPGFYEVKNAALNSGAIMSSFSGSGPTLFALADTQIDAKQIAENMQKEFLKLEIKSEYWIAKMQSKKAYVIESY